MRLYSFWVETGAAAMIAYPLRQYKDLFTFLLMAFFFPPKKEPARAVCTNLIAVVAARAI